MKPCSEPPQDYARVSPWLNPLFYFRMIGSHSLDPGVAVICKRLVERIGEHREEKMISGVVEFLENGAGKYLLRNSGGGTGWDGAR